jgi:hypothetical protein
MAGLRGNLGTLREIKRSIAAMPVSVGHAVAQQSAPAITGLAQQAYDGGQNVYGDARPRSKVTGAALTLEQTGRTRAGMRFEAVGTQMICVLPTAWAKYLVGKYQILPQGALPAVWTEKIGQVVARVRVPL